MGDSYFKHCSMFDYRFISLACVKSTNIISSHKITKYFSELNAELASVTFISPAACLTMTTAIVPFHYIEIYQPLISNDTLIFMLLHKTERRAWQDFISSPFCNLEDVDQIFHNSSVPGTFLRSTITIYSIGSKKSLKANVFFNSAVTHAIELDICLFFICFFVLFFK